MIRPFTGIEACVFDAYGTLLDLATATGRFTDILGEKASPLAAAWRTRQLEYSWLCSMMGRYVDFWRITADSLRDAMADVDLAYPDLERDLLAQYRKLDAYADAAPALAALRQRGLRTAILSNGTPDMLADGIAGAGLADRLDAVLSVDVVRAYKPDPRVYRLACDHFSLDPGRICFVSSNDWDAAGARAFGFRVVWLNRSRRTWPRLPVSPDETVDGLDALVSLVIP